MTKPLLSAEWIARCAQFEQLIVGFSGGLDSTVLLHALAANSALHSKLLAVHIHHGISPNAMSWQMHCQHFCAAAGINFVAHSVEFNRSANVEEGAREARYAFFSSLVTAKSCLVLGHHQDDQAETLLLQLFRGAGVGGLAAMAEWSVWENSILARPLLTCTRKELEQYAALHQLEWVEDESNQEINYARNYLRHQVIPLLKQQWPGVVGNIARTAVHCQKAKANLDELALLDHPNLGTARQSLPIAPLKNLTADRCMNVLLLWLKNNKVQLPSASTLQRLTDELLWAKQDAGPVVSWGDVQVRRYQNDLYLVRQGLNLPTFIEWNEFPASLVLPEYNLHLEAHKNSPGLLIASQAKIFIRFRQGGEQFYWHGQHKQLKKLFQEWGVPPWLRDTIPLVYVEDQLAAILGYAISDYFYSESSEAWQIEQFVLAQPNRDYINTQAN